MNGNNKKACKQMILEYLYANVSFCSTRIDFETILTQNLNTFTDYSKHRYWVPNVRKYKGPFNIFCEYRHLYKLIKQYSTLLICNSSGLNRKSNYLDAGKDEWLGKFLL